MQNQKYNEPSDKLIPDLMSHAQTAIKSWQGNTKMTPRVMFKHTCTSCGKRGFIDRADTVPQIVRCNSCGNVEPYTTGGYSLAFELAGTKPHGYTDSYGHDVTFARPTQCNVLERAPSLTPDIPTKIGARLNADQTLTPIDRDALMQFAATVEAQTGGAK